MAKNSRNLHRKILAAALGAAYFLSSSGALSLWAAAAQSSAASAPAREQAAAFLGSLRLLSPELKFTSIEVPPDLAGRITQGNWEKIRVLFGSEELPPPENGTLPSELTARRDAALRSIRDACAVLDAVEGDALSNPKTRERILRRLQDAVAPAPAPSWPENKERILEESLRLKARLDELIQKDFPGLDPGQMRQLMEQDKITARIPSLGKAALNTLDGSSIVRVVHEPSRLSVAFVEKDAVSRDSRHLRQYVARQHTESGQTDGDWALGRDVVLAWTQDGRVVETEFLGRPRWTQREWWADQWYRVYKKPTREQIEQGFFWAAAQAVIVEGITGVVLPLLHHPIGHSLVLAGFTFGYAWLMGAYNSAYRNWSKVIYRGKPKPPETDSWGARLRHRVRDFLQKRPRLISNLKSWPVSLAYAYPVKAFRHGLAALSPLHPLGWLLSLSIFQNVWLNNYGKIGWQEVENVAEANGMLTRPLEFRAPGLYRREGRPRLGMRTYQWNRASFAYQSLYMINWFFRLLDLTGVIYAGIPIGLAVFLLSIPLGRALCVRYAEMNGFRQAAPLRESWEKSMERRLIGAVGLERPLFRSADWLLRRAPGLRTLSKPEALKQ